jgi:hypothetical protein
MGQRFVKTIIRCAIWPSKVGVKFERLEGGTPQGFKATGMEFQFAFFGADDLLLDVSNIASVSVIVKPTGQPDALAEMNKGVIRPNINTGLTIEQWKAGTSQHVAIPFIKAETAIGAGPHDLTVSGFTDDDVADDDVFGISTLTIINAGTYTGLVIPPLDATPAATLDQIRGLLAGFVQQRMKPGQMITLVSDDSKVMRTIGVQNKPDAAGNPQVFNVDDPEIVG